MQQQSLFSDPEHEAERERARQVYERINAIVNSNRDDWYPTSLSHYIGQPFKALVAAMLSAQTREEQTTAATKALFALADNPADMLQLRDDAIMNAIAPVSYARSKLDYLRDICAKVLEDGGKVPNDVDAIMRYKGVGWKVGTLTLLIAYGRDEDIPVDVHVKRVGIRLGFVEPETKQAKAVSESLKAVLPRDAWGKWNPFMVQFGREVCTGRSPKCSTCPVNDLCPKVGVTSRR